MRIVGFTRMEKKALEKAIKRSRTTEKKLEGTIIKPLHKRYTMGGIKYGQTITYGDIKTGEPSSTRVYIAKKTFKRPKLLREVIHHEARHISQHKSTTPTEFKRIRKQQMKTGTYKGKELAERQARLYGKKML